MADSVSLLRQRIEDPQLASQDETMNSVVTLAAIEVRDFGVFLCSDRYDLLTLLLTVW